MINSSSHRLIVLPEGASNGQIVWVHPKCGLVGPAALSLVGDGEIQATIAVNIIHSRRLPQSALAIGAELADSIPLFPDDVWELDTSLPTVNATRICISSHDDGLEISKFANKIAGSLVLVNEESTEFSPIEHDGQLLTVRDLEPELAGATKKVVRVSDETMIEMEVNVGWDIVVLADCSSSMHINDQLDDTDSSSEEADPSKRVGIEAGKRIVIKSSRKPLERMAALKKSLSKFLDQPDLWNGRSRIAIVGFSDICEQMYPIEGGLARLVGSSEIEKRAFLNAIRGLWYKNKGDTRIGLALEFAGNLLQRHRIDGNRQLIILISDGAEFCATTEEMTGEFVMSFDDPEEVLKRLNNCFDDLRLHAIALGTRTGFEKWLAAKLDRQIKYGSEKNIGWARPDHSLLERLVESGEKVSTFENVRALSKYFSDLGSGIRLPIGFPAPAEPPNPLSENNLRLISEMAHSPARTSDPVRKLELHSRILETYKQLHSLLSKCESLASEILEVDRRASHDKSSRPPHKLFEHKSLFVQAIGFRAETENQFIEFVKQVYKGLFERYSLYFFGGRQSKKSLPRPTEHGRVEFENVEMDEGFTSHPSGKLKVVHKSGRSQVFHLPLGAELHVEEGEMVKPDHVLFQPFPSLHKLIFSEFNRDLAVLRNKFSHAKDANDERAVRAVYAKLGIPQHPHPEDGTVWLKAQLEAMSGLYSFFDQVFLEMKGRSPVTADFPSDPTSDNQSSLARRIIGYRNPNSVGNPSSTNPNR